MSRRKSYPGFGGSTGTAPRVGVGLVLDQRRLRPGPDRFGHMHDVVKARVGRRGSYLADEHLFAILLFPPNICSGSEPDFAGLYFFFLKMQLILQ